MTAESFEAVPLSRYRETLRTAGDACRRLNAVEMFTPQQAAAFVGFLDDLFNAIDSRLGNLEYRLDEAGIKEPDGGIPDDKCGNYFTLEVPSNFEPPR